MPYDISENKRDWYRSVAARSRRRKKAACNGELKSGPKKVNIPALRPEDLMPQQEGHGLTALSLFSGGGGLDLAFDRAGFEHVASFDILEICGATLRRSRPNWQVFSGPGGDVGRVNFSRFAGGIDVIHGGPPCQPFSVAGKCNGGRDKRDMWPAFVSAILKVRPAVFIAENVPGLLAPKFSQYIDEVILKPLEAEYHIMKFSLLASDFGVPQVRKGSYSSVSHQGKLSNTSGSQSQRIVSKTTCFLSQTAPWGLERRWGFRISASTALLLPFGPASLDLENPQVF